MRIPKTPSTSWIGTGFWCLVSASLFLWINSHPLIRSVTEIYRDAVNFWKNTAPIYTGPSGFNYLPIFVIFFEPFTKLSLVVGETLWRWLALLGLFTGTRQCTWMIAKSDQAFLTVSFLSLPICISALRNGQSSAHLAACLVLAASCLARRHWRLAVLFLSLSLVCKPLGLAAIGLAIMAFPRLGWRQIIALIVVIALPYAFRDAAYINGLYLAFMKNIVDCFAPSPGRTFADINGFLMVFGITLTGTASFITRVSAGALFAYFCWTTRHKPDLTERALFWLTLAGTYIMLFTPMNEANSYVMLAPSFGLWSARFVEQQKLFEARMIAWGCVLFLFLPDLIGILFGKYFGNQFAKFLYPFLTIGFFGLILRDILSGSSKFAAGIQE